MTTQSCGTLGGIIKRWPQGNRRGAWNRTSAAMQPRRTDKSYICMVTTEAALFRGERVAIVSPDGWICIVIPGPWQYIPSWMRRS